jgi:HD-like signal output (HDOD) protein
LGPSTKNRSASQPSVDVGKAIEKAIAERSLDLPVLPATSLKVLEVCEDTSSTAQSLSEVLEADPTLTTHVLRIANSPISGSRVEITSLAQAVSRLGMRQVAEIAITVSVRSRLFDLKLHTKLIERLWKHASVSAYASRGVAKRMRRVSENVYLGGLLHDIGFAVGLAVVEDLEKKIGVEALPDKLVMDALERHHVQAGLALVEEWHLPAPIQSAITEHGVMDDSVPLDTCIVGVGDCLATYGLGDITKVGVDDLRTLPVLERLNLYPDDVDALLELVPGWIEAAEIF